MLFHALLALEATTRLPGGEEAWSRKADPGLEFLERAVRAHLHHGKAASIACDLLGAIPSPPPPRATALAVLILQAHPSQGALVERLVASLALPGTLSQSHHHPEILPLVLLAAERHPGCLEPCSAVLTAMFTQGEAPTPPAQAGAALTGPLKAAAAVAAAAAKARKERLQHCLSELFQSPWRGLGLAVVSLLLEPHNEEALERLRFHRVQDLGEVPLAECRAPNLTLI